nr:caspase-7-like [Pocillopora verrucosa]
MNKDPRGLCVIVNNVNFQNRDLNRPGAVEDERSLQLLFRTLFFEVIIRRDLTSHELEKVAQKFGAANHKAYNAFVFIVMSHGGDRDCILGVDGRETTVKNLMCEFRENKCPSLKHKPKAFIIQTCRGCRDNADNSTSSPVNDINLQQKVATTSQAQISSQPCDTAFVTDCTLPRSVFPPEADFVLAFATAPGYVSYRDPDNGTWFIQALVEVISKYHHHHHFLEILTEVTRLVVERVNSVQVPAPMDTLTKFLYL